MYENRNHATDSAIGTLIRSVKDKVGTNGDAIVNELLLVEGCELRADGSGTVHIRLGKETCAYPLGVTELPANADQAH